MGGSRRTGGYLVSLSRFSSVSGAAYQSASVGLGAHPVRSDGIGDAVPGGEFSAHQRARNESRCSGSSCVSAPVVWSVS